MRELRDIMGMPVSIEIIDGQTPTDTIQAAFDYFEYVDRTFSTYKETSEISQLNRGELPPDAYSADMREVLAICEQTRVETRGYFDIRTPNGLLDPSGVVKGWAIRNAAQLIVSRGHQNFFVDAGGDVQTSGVNGEGGEWSVGIRHPVELEKIVKVIYPKGKGVATSGTYLRGEHIYDPHTGKPASEVVSLTVIGPDVLEADRFATAAVAMGREGIEFIASREGFEGYMIDSSLTATMTPHFARYTQQ